MRSRALQHSLEACLEPWGGRHAIVEHEPFVIVEVFIPERVKKKTNDQRIS